MLNDPWAKAKRASDVTTLSVGDLIVTGSGVGITITRISVGQFHRPNPTVWVAYDYDDNGHKGSESNSLGNFYNLIHE